MTRFPAVRTAPAKLLIKTAAGWDPALGVLLLAPPEPGLAAGLARVWPDVHVLHHHYGNYLDDLAAGGAPSRVHFGPAPGAEVPARDLAVVFLPKEKQRFRFLVAAAAERLRPGGEVAVVGENQAGARSVGKWLKQQVGPLVEKTAGRHCTLWRVRLERAAPREAPVRHQVDVPGGALTVVSHPGVFSQGRLDAGTRMLLEALPALEGRVLDWGCGAGVIGVAVARAHPQTEVTLADVDAMALASARETVHANGVDVRTVPADVFRGLEGPFDTLVANPPFHAGVRTSTRAASSMVAEAPGYLTPRGEVFLVTNSFIRHDAALREGFADVRVAAGDARFRVLHAAKPLRPARGKEKPRRPKPPGKPMPPRG